MSIDIYVPSSEKTISQRRLETYRQYNKIVQWGRRDPVGFCRRVFGIELLDYQKFAIANTWTAGFAAWLQSRNAGKAGALTTPVPTPDGTRILGEIHPGDYVFNENGKPIKVLGESEIFLGRPCYEVSFSDGEKIVCDANHLWTVSGVGSIWNRDEYDCITLSTKEMVCDYVSKDGVYKYSPVPAYCDTEPKWIESIKGVPSVATKCIAVDNPRGLFLWGEHNTVTHNSTLASIYTMLRSVLFPGYQSYFISNVGAQAKETFLKLEHIAKQEISTFANCTDVFLQEVERSNAVSDGFIHLSEGFKTKLFNGSEIFTLNSDPTNVKGRRANGVYVDEAGWVSEELMMQVEQFANQNENFKLGAGFDAKCEPKDFPRQLIYGSSASDTDTAFYKKVREYTKQMLKGDARYFVCDFDIDAVMAATVNGEPLAEPLISQSKIDQAVLLAPDKAQRELWNHFSNESHEGQILTSREIMQHTSNFLPVLSNPDGGHMYMFSWDSARINDNSVIEVAELIDDPKVGWKMRLVNVHNLVDVDNKRKTPMTLPEQVREFKKLLLAYNGNIHGKLDYENIKAVVCDSGAAGQMIGGVTDYLLEEWVDNGNIKHKGLIDKSHKSSQAAKFRYPDAVDIIKLIDPKAHRNDLLQAISDMVKLGVVEFPVDYDVSKDYITFVEEDGTETRHDLTLEEQVALAQIDLTKTEIVTMCKYTNLGNVTFNFPPELRNKMHDDRVFAFGLLCYQLSLLRRKQVTHKPQKAETIMSMPTLATAVSFEDGFDY